MNELLIEVNPELNRGWHAEINGELRFEEVRARSSKNVWWRCRTNPSHEWQASIRRRAIEKYGCPYCSGRYLSYERAFAAQRPELASEWHPERNGDLKPEAVSLSSNAKIWWRCKDGHEWQTSVRHRARSRSKCPVCRVVEGAMERELPDPFAGGVASTLLGSRSFVEWVQEQFLEEKSEDRELPALRELRDRPSLERIRQAAEHPFATDRAAARRVALYLSHRYSGRKLRDIGASYRVTESAVTQASHRVAESLKENASLRKEVEKLEKQLSSSRR